MTRHFLLGADAILRAGSTAAAGTVEQLPWKRTAVYLIVCGCSYGALMGTFGGISGDRLLLLLYAAIKVPLLLLATFLICLPSFFVLNTLFGLRADFGVALNALVLTQAALTILLVALAPYTLLWYASFSDYDAAVLFNAVIFGAATLAAQWLLRRLYRPLIAQNVRHRLLLRTWLALFAFVGIQTAWVLRPFIGSPDLPAEFFREEAWGNAYVVVGEKIHRLLFR